MIDQSAVVTPHVLQRQAEGNVSYITSKDTIARHHYFPQDAQFDALAWSTLYYSLAQRITASLNE